MAYQLFVDKQEVFECSIKLEGASISNAKARLILESDNLNLVFYGKIDSKGNCSVPIKKLKNILPESTEGSMTLEVIADDTYFEPWTSDFHVKASKAVKVEVREQKINKPEIKAIVEVKVEDIYEDYVNTMVSFLNKEGITTKNISKNKKVIRPIINKYIEKTNIDNRSKFLKEVLKKL